MRIVALEVNGFRGFSGRHEFDLDAGAVVVIGANGQGKTSFFDAILWGLTGQIPRLGEKLHIACLFSESGSARVELELRDERGAPLHVVRSLDAGGMRLSILYEDKEAHDEAATLRLYELLWPNASHAQDAAASLTDAVTRSVYLQQDLVRGFVESDSEQDRFRALSELVGAGRVTELALVLEGEKKAWSRTTNERDRELDDKRNALLTREEQLRALTDAEPIDDRRLGERWGVWWNEAALHEVVPAGGVPSQGSTEGAGALDIAMRGLESARRGVERREALAARLLDDLEEREAATPIAADELSRLHAEEAEAAERERRARESLQVAENEAAERRRIQVQRRESGEELRAIADLALRHIDGPCPVCAQDHDLEHTRARLEGILEDRENPVDGAGEDDGVSSAAEELQGVEQAHAAAQSALRAMESKVREEALWRAELDRRLDELGIEPREGVEEAEYRPQVEDLRRALLSKRDAIDKLEAEGERLSLELARAGEQVRRRELAENLQIARDEVAKLAVWVDNRRRTGDLAGRILEALRDASSELVAAQLNDIAPLLQHIYSTADPHPLFRAVTLLPTLARGRGRLNTRLDDSAGSIWTDAPEAVLSSSQLNALAVSMFLALNLGVPSLPVQAAMLDDPLQSLDDVNLLGLIDLLRRAKARRQLIVSTHDHRFGELLSRKLRPVRDGERTRVIQLGGWGRKGPTVDQWDAPGDHETLRIAAEP